MSTTELLEAVSDRAPHSSEDLLPLVYNELRRLAVQKLAHERPGHTLQPTALVHEAYLRLLNSDPHWENCSHFFAAAAEAMRRLLVDNARRKQQEKHGGNRQRLELHESDSIVCPPSEDLLALNEALEEFAAEDPQAAELVKLRYFAGMTLQEAAEILEVPRRTADRLWVYARTWLFRQVSKGDELD